MPRRAPSPAADLAFEIFPADPTRSDPDFTTLEQSGDRRNFSQEKPAVLLKTTWTSIKNTDRNGGIPILIPHTPEKDTRR